jgi:hypothetical protein
MIRTNSTRRMCVAVLSMSAHAVRRWSRSTSRLVAAGMRVLGVGVSAEHWAAGGSPSERPRQATLPQADFSAEREMAGSTADQACSVET